MLLALYALLQHHSGSDELARTMTFTVLVLSNLGLIHANRRWHATDPRASTGNPYARWFYAVALLILGLVLGLAPLRQLFALSLPTLGLLLHAAGLALLNLGRFRLLNDLQCRAKPRR